MENPTNVNPVGEGPTSTGKSKKGIKLRCLKQYCTWYFNERVRTVWISNQVLGFPMNKNGKNPEFLTWSSGFFQGQFTLTGSVEFATR